MALTVTTGPNAALRSSSTYVLLEYFAYTVKDVVYTRIIGEVSVIAHHEV